MLLRGEGTRPTMGGVKLAERIQEHRQEILAVAARHGAEDVGLFGSAARGEEGPDSDVDIVVDIVGETSPWFPDGLAVELEQMLGRRVQIVMRRSLSPWIRETVLKEARPL